MERFGIEKRHILRSRVEDGQREQREAQEQVPGRLRTLPGRDRLRRRAIWRRSTASSLESSSAARKRPRAVRDRVASIERVAEDLFSEWQAEIGQIGSASLRSASERSLRDTRSRYSGLLAAMQRAESRMEPVLAAFRDQVLFLKHNLNARAIASLEGSVAEIEDDVAALIRDIDVSIGEAERFLAELQD